MTLSPTFQSLANLLTQHSAIKPLLDQPINEQLKKHLKLLVSLSNVFATLIFVEPRRCYDATTQRCYAPTKNATKILGAVFNVFLPDCARKDGNGFFPCFSTRVRRSLILFAK